MRPHGRPKHRWRGNTEMDLKETGLEDTNRIHREYNRVQQEFTPL
jgi:hypothetical protein